MPLSLAPDARAIKYGRSAAAGTAELAGRTGGLSPASAGRCTAQATSGAVHARVMRHTGRAPATAARCRGSSSFTPIIRLLVSCTCAAARESRRCARAVCAAARPCTPLFGRAHLVAVAQEGALCLVRVAEADVHPVRGLRREGARVDHLAALLQSGGTPLSERSPARRGRARVAPRAWNSRSTASLSSGVNPYTVTQVSAASAGGAPCSPSCTRAASAARQARARAACRVRACTHAPGTAKPAAAAAAAAARRAAPLARLCKGSSAFGART
jgi:hypothetical protein